LKGIQLAQFVEDDHPNPHVASPRELASMEERGVMEDLEGYVVVKYTVPSTDKRIEEGGALQQVWKFKDEKALWKLVLYFERR
jgi:hypothetical protein